MTTDQRSPAGAKATPETLMKSHNVQRSSRFIHRAVLSAIALSFPAVALAAPVPPATNPSAMPKSFVPGAYDMPVNSETREAVVRGVGKALVESYVFPD